MNYKEFKKVQENYGQCVKKGRPGRNRRGREITDQTEWIWFDRKTIEKLLANMDSDESGVKIYFGQYTEDTPPHKVEEIAASEKIRKDDDYDGQLTVMLVAARLDQSASEKTLIINGGKLCPPQCGGR